MAIVAGDEVALTRAASLATLAARGNVLFGICTDVTLGEADVAWENGLASTDLPVDLLDTIAGANGPTQVVEFTDASGGPNSPAYQGIVVRSYTRTPNGSVTPVAYKLIQLLETGELLEVPATAVRELAGR